MLQTFYDLRIKSIISNNTPIILFNFIASRINKEIIFKNYQKKLNLKGTAQYFIPRQNNYWGLQNPLQEKILIHYLKFLNDWF